MPGFEFATATRVIFGDGSIDRVGKLAAELGHNALVVVGEDASRAEKLYNQIHTFGLTATTIQIAGEPVVSDIQAGVDIARSSRTDLVIGFGGGSALDAGKAIAGLATNPGEVYDYLEVVGAGAPLTEKPLPFIAIPTTAGTGSEVTRNAVLGVPEKQVKVSLRSLQLIPDIALVDPELTHSLPADVTANTGLDALTQLIEPYVSNQSNQLTDLFCLEGIRLVAASLERACADGNDADARRDMAMASLYGGIALANAKLGAVHGLAGVLGAMFDAPHGAICARLLPEVMQMNLHKLSTQTRESVYLERYATIAKVLTGDPHASAEDGVQSVKMLCDRLVIPGLAEYGVNEAIFPDITQRAKGASSMKGNPVLLSAEELAKILRMSLS